MTDQEKREMIERALNRFDAFYGKDTSDDNAILVDVDALAEKAIVVPAEVEWRGGVTLRARTLIYSNVGVDKYFLEKDGHHGIPGEALAIILPLEEEPQE